MIAYLFINLTIFYMWDSNIGFASAPYIILLLSNIIITLFLYYHEGIVPINLNFHICIFSIFILVGGICDVSFMLFYFFEKKWLVITLINYFKIYKFLFPWCTSISIYWSLIIMGFLYNEVYEELNDLQSAYLFWLTAFFLIFLILMLGEIDGVG